MRAVALCTLLLLGGCAPTPVVQEPVIITVPEYLLVTANPTAPPTEEQFVNATPKEQVELLTGVLRAVYADYAGLVKQIQSIAKRQQAILESTKEAP